MTNELQQIYKYTQIATNDKRITTNDLLSFVFKFVAIRIFNILDSLLFVNRFVAISVANILDSLLFALNQNKFGSGRPEPCSVPNQNEVRFGIPYRALLWYGALVRGVLKFVAISVFILLPIFTAFAADLYILPSSKNLNIGDNLNIAVYVDSIDQAINAISFKISYPEDLLKFVSLSKTGTIINLWVQEPKGGNGEVFAEGIILNPGFTGSKGKILNINFKALKPGKADVKFVAGSVLANDGLGTNVLKDMKGGSYTIKKVLDETPAISYLPTPKIISPTHPDQEKWYNNNNPIFEWPLPKEAIEVKTLYSKNLNEAPFIRHYPPISKIELKDVPDGTYWFSIQFIGEDTESNIGRFKFNIDTQPPVLEIFSLSLIDSNSIKLEVKTKDELSGVDKIDVYLDNNLVFSTSTDIFENIIKNIEPGIHNLKLVIYDKAHNIFQKEEIVNLPRQTVKTEIVVQKDYALYFVILFVLILLIIIFLIIYFMRRRLETIHKEIKKEKIEVLKTDLKKHIKEILNDLKYNISLLDEDPKLNQKEKELYKEVQNILEAAEKQVEDKLKEL